MITANLGIALSNLGHETTILDGDIAMANLAIIMGLSKTELSFLDVLLGRADVADATYSNHGVKVIPCGFRFEDVHDALSKVKRERVEEIVGELLRRTEFMLIDAPAGITDATIISIAAAREMIPVTNLRIRRCYPHLSCLVPPAQMLFQTALGCVPPDPGPDAGPRG
jgi:septum site-determining protein MinD